MSAAASSQKDIGPTDIDLANYARAYVNAYMGAVQSESPEHPPVFFRNHPYSIEACFMPNESFCLLFEKSDKPTISVTSQDWDHVMGRVMSGVSYLATVYPHEGYSVDDAVSKGRRDAIRDIRAMESSDMAEAARQLEKVIAELGNMGDWMKNPVKMAETVMSRLEPVRHAIQRSGPTQDMLAMVDGMRRYNIGPQRAPGLAPSDLQTIQATTALMSEVSLMLKDVKAQGEKLESVEEQLRTELHEFKKELDKKVVKGLGVILATTDRKIDKAVASTQTPPRDPRMQAAVAGLADDVSALKKAVDALQAPKEEPEDDLPERLDALVREVAAVRSVAESIEIPELPKLPPDLSPNVEAITNDLAKVSVRIKRIEDYLAAFSAALKHP